MSVPEVTLEETCDFLSGFAWSATKFNTSSLGIPIIRIQNVDSSRDKDFIYWDEPYEERFVIEKDDLLLTLSGSFRVGLWDGPSALLNQRIVKLIPKKNVTPEWLLHILRHRIAKISNLGRHALVSNVALADLRKFSVPLPSLPEQRRIAAILDQADALRAKRREALAQLDSLTQSIFIEMFGDPLTNSKGWPTKSLGEVTTLFGGNSLPEGEPFLEQKGGLFLMKVSDMNLPGNERTIERCQSWSSVTGARAATCPVGSIVIPKRGGAIGTNKKRVTKRETILDPNLMAISPNSTFIEREYLFQWFQRFDLSTIASGSSVPQLNKQDLVPLKIQIPPRSIQQIFSARIEAIEVIKVSSAAALVKLDTLFASLQHRAFQGEL